MAGSRCISAGRTNPGFRPGLQAGSPAAHVADADGAAHEAGEDHIDGPQAQVSPGTPLLLIPPNSTTLPLAASYVESVSYRAVGWDAGACLVQVEPSQVHVSSSGFTRRSWPPNSTTVPVAASYADVARYRAAGWATGARFVQVEPSQVQVSPSTPLLPKPPNSTVVPVAAS